MNVEWKLEFENLMLAGSLTEGKNLKNRYFPKSLFKYRNLNKHTLDNLFNQNVWVCSPLSMNDPYECSVYVDYLKFSRYQSDKRDFWDSHDMSGFYQLGYSEKDLEVIKKSSDPFMRYVELMRAKSSDVKSFDLLIEMADNKSKERFNEYREQYIRLLKTIVRIYSMSERNDSLLMWSHYAEQHQGICVEYDLSDSIFLRDNTYPALYRNYVLDVTEYFFNKDKTFLMSLLSSLYKTEDWHYEKEWRLTIPNNIVGEDKNFNFPKPVAIYFGSEIDAIKDENKKGILAQIVKFAAEQKIPKYKMKLERDCFKMTPQEMH